MFVYLFTGLAVTLISACFLLCPRVSDRYVRLHVLSLALPTVAAFAGLISADQTQEMGFWRSDRLTWLISFYVLLLGWTIQRFSIRYMYGDRSYRSYFALLTVTVGAASITWTSDDLRLLVLLWGLPLLGLVWLSALKKEWEPARNVSRLMAKMFAASWISLLLAVVWLWKATGYWRISLALSVESLTRIEWENATGISVLLVLAAIIPAGQWPFQRWLLESSVMPTPVSSAMHAGLVNAGGILLAKFSPLMAGGFPQTLLLFPAVVSVIVGTGILLVQPDYKRQLVASTMAQMGMMFIQCALGAYSLAVLHLIFHGLFKATLFLRSGSVVPRSKRALISPYPPSKMWILCGMLGGIVLGVGFWLAAPHEHLRMLRALLLGWSLAFAWWQMAVFHNGRWTGFFVLSGLGLSAMAFHDALAAFLGGTLPAAGPGAGAESGIVLLFVCLGLAGIFFSGRCSTDLWAKLYMWLVHIGEARDRAVESHPRYLKAYVRQGGE
ncbi:NADH dehydrogenase subunit 5 [Brevibacillus sp. LEMMJ03]|uniref:NADH dehydrogenase subunit 5 n=1 Tax=Brevibacillus sp. LEMMJ03 TaxID=2595056 RepID=UPI00117F876D|nr:NADH dehydrogenase subunit 5 [Brevibacillus sp. LEMMJ03]TRY22750.1 NADH dehydrogenase subunit 5 [Brevibacillus sp. LEMMJ03]